MKKLILFLVLLLFPVIVYAEEYDVQKLIPVDTVASVKTEKFNYNNFIYNSSVDEKGNSLITFESIENNTVSKVPISINILLFDVNQKNIGYLTYCTDKDLDSSYSGYKLSGKGSSSFSIRVVSKYFVEGKSTKDVKYISVFDENKYCQIGGYDNYKDLTLDEIVNGVGVKKDENEITKFINELKENEMMPTIIFGLVAFVVFIILLMIIGNIVKMIKKRKRTKVESIKIDEPMEETVDLRYGKVDESDIDEEESISMGEVNNTLDDDSSDNNNKEDGSDLTKFFN